MGSDADRLPDGWHTERPATDAEIVAVQAAAHCVLPNGYEAFLRKYGGGYGPAGKDDIELWAAREVPDLNAEYHGGSKAADTSSVFYIGTNGGGEALALKRDGPPGRIYLAPFISDDPEDCLAVCDTLGTLLANGYSQPLGWE